MKKTFMKKLVLNKEVIRNLEAGELVQVHGGNGGPQKSITRCGSQCCSNIVCSAPGVCVTVTEG